MSQISHQNCCASQRSRIVMEVRYPRRWRFWAQVLVVALLVSAARAQLPKQLWVLQEPDQIIGYDVAGFVPQHTLRIPFRLLLEHPEYLSINAMGQMLFLLPRGLQFFGPGGIAVADRTWFWDGHQTRELNVEGTKIRGRNGGRPTVKETAPQYFLTAGGDSLVWFENKFEKVLDESGLERSVRSAWRVWRTDLAGQRPEMIASLTSPAWCQCDTGTCSETCPEWYFGAPHGVVGDFFLVTRFTPGQLGSTYHESLLYQLSGRTWRAKELPQPIMQPLTASEKGEVLVALAPDTGCCGWASSNQMLLVRNGKVSVLYDEFGRYGYRSYDVSFYVPDARLAAGNAMLAYTIASTARTGDEIPLSPNGKENAEELARVRKTIAELPAVEIVQLEAQPRQATLIRHAALVGWMGDQEILVAQDGHLAVYDIRGRKLRDIPIRVRSAADAFLR